MSEPDALIVYDDGPIRHIRFNRPERLNALDLDQHERVISAMREAESDSDVRVIAFSGEGRAFCAGDDLKGGGSTWPDRYRERRVDLDIGIGPLLLQEVTSIIRDMPKPTVVLMHGYALGAGYDYATSCDFRLATEDCRFGDPRVHRAMWAAEGWSYKLTRLIPQTHAARIAYLGEPLTGKEAWEVGLVHRTYPSGADLRDAAREFLLQAAALDAETYALIKRDIIDSLDLRYEQAIARHPSAL